MANVYTQIKRAIIDALTDVGEDVEIGDLATKGNTPMLAVKGDNDDDDDPGVVVLYEADGTAQYLWVDSGKLRIHSSAPSTAASDGSVVGSQS